MHRRAALLVLSLVPSGCAAPPALTVMTYNIHHGRGADGVIDLDRIARVIRSADPDIVLLQEVDRRTKRSSAIDQAGTLGDLTGLVATFGPHRAYDGGEYGVAILTRAQPTAVRVLPLPPGPDPLAALCVEVDGLRVCSAHLYRSPEQRLAQARALTAELDPAARPTLLGGDFNGTRAGAVLRALSADWSTSAGGDATYPAHGPVREIDFVVFSPGAFEVDSWHVLPEASASDHRPLVVRLVPSSRYLAMRRRRD